jgi:S1-C subfamily serine protease
VALLALPAFLAAAQAALCLKPLDTCVAEKRRAYADRGVLGFLWAEVSEDERVPHLDKVEYLVRAVPRGYPAHSAGLREGDLLLAIDGKSALGVTRDLLGQRLGSITVGRVVTVQVLRGGGRLEIPVTAGRPDPQSVEAWVGQHVREAHSPEEYRHYLRALKVSSSPRP